MKRRYYSLYGRLLEKPVLIKAYRQVKRAKGAAGIDRQSIAAFGANLDIELETLRQELKEKTYQPKPVRRVEIPKPNGGIRLLGVPTVRDRIVQQALKEILEPIFDPDFHPSSYGYRKGKSGHQAIEKASLFIRRYERRWVVDMDLSKCFDTLEHEIILEQFGRKIADGGVLKLLKLILESGVMIGDSYKATELGSPQGGVISPLIANVYLDDFDQHMKSRGHRIVRYADDILILCCSKPAAENAMQVAKSYLEEELKLQVNQEKTHLIHSDEGVKYLGVVIYTNYTKIQVKKVESFKEKVRYITRRNTGKRLSEVIIDLNRVLRGFVNYFKIANCQRVLKDLMGWIRRRLRCIQLKLWKRPSRLHRRLKQLGYKPPFKFIKMRSWRNAASPLASLSMPNKWLHEEMKLVNMVEIKSKIAAVHAI